MPIGRPRVEAENRGFGTIAEPPIRTNARDARREAAAIIGVSEKYISDAERIREKSPETADAVRRGEKTIPQAKRELGLGPSKPKAAAIPGPELTPDRDEQFSLAPEAASPAESKRFEDTWEAVYAAYRLAARSIEKLGGIEMVAREWDKDRIEGAIGFADKVVAVFQELGTKLRRCLDEGR
jgi:hypothetical protein